MGDQHRSEKRNDRQGQISLWRMLCLTTRKCGIRTVEQPAIGSQRACEGRGADRTAEGRLARWCGRKPRDWEDVGNHGTPQIARAVERGAHNESSVAAMLHVR